MKNAQMKKRMRIMLICMGVLFAAILIYKVAMLLLFKHFMAKRSQVVTVSAMKVSYSPWQPQIHAVGSLRAIRGVNVTTELAGMVQAIYFAPGAVATENATLVQLNADTDVAQLNALRAQAELANVTYERDRAQYKAQAISKATLDADSANLKNLQAQVAAQTAILDKKTIRAPFSGRLGISAINRGQYLNPGDKVVTLQQLDPIYIDFYVPQQAFMQLAVGQPVRVTVDAFPGEIFSGNITTIDPLVDTTTRNMEVEATLANPKLHMIPGMFAAVTVNTGKAQRFLTLPQTAVSFNSYGSVVFVVKKTEQKDSDDEPILTVKQQLITTGEVRGDQVTVLQGLQEGDEVVTSGQLKLKNGTQVVIDNSVVPANRAAPVLHNGF